MEYTLFKKLIFIAIFLASLSITGFSKADIPLGSNDPVFLATIETWLDDNDVDSLSALSSLAHEGNIAARLLLSRIEITDRASSNYVKGLSRTQRLDLFRPKYKDSIFRPSWLKVEADKGNSTAKALLDSTALGINIAAIKRLYDMGEIEATEHLIRKIAVDGSSKERQQLAELLIPKSELVPYLQAFRYANEGMTTGRTALQHIISTIENIEPESVDLDQDLDTKMATMFMGIGYQAGDQTPGYSKNNKYFHSVAKWAMMAPETTAIANLCHRACEDEEIPACANTALGLVGGYYEAIRFDSPLESIIPQSRFLNSERAIGTTLRRIAFARSEAGTEIFSDQELSEKSRCLANAILKLRAQTN